MTAERPTPETDAVKFQIGDSNHFAVHVVHARRLERERDEALLFNMRASRDTSLYASMLHEKLDDHRFLLREIFNLTQIGDPHPADLPVRALQAIAEMIDGHLKEARK